QGLAIFLTYTAIVLTYIPPIMQAISKRADEEAAAKSEQPAKPAGAADAPGDADARPRPSIAQAVFALALLLAFAYAIPVMIGFHSLMGLIIVGIALYEAW